MLVFCKIQLAQATEISPISPLFGVGQENFSFGLTVASGNKQDMTFEPNMAGVSRLGINAFGFGVGYSFRDNSKKLDPAQGTTNFFDLQLGYQSKNWGIDTYYQTYEGFYSNSTQTLQLYPDLHFHHSGVNVRFALNESDFTVNGLLDQSDNIKTTSQKYYLVTGLQQHIMQNKISLLQQDYIGLNPELEDLRNLSAVSVSLGVGGGKYWVNEAHFFIGALLDLIGTYGGYTYDNTASSTSSSYATLSYDLKVGLGYSGEAFKTGLGFTTDTTTLKTPGASYLKASASRAMIYVRYVF